MTHTVPTMEGENAAARAPVRVLVVDDSRLQRRLLRGALEKWGFSVVEAESGEAALAALGDHPADIVISDWMMPGMSGLELCAACREALGERYAYFILLTSKSEKEEIATGLNSGADDFLTKPVNSGELLARVRAGVRIVGMQRSLAEKNRELADSLAEIETLYAAIRRDLEGAKKLQESLVPRSELDFGHGRVAMLLRSSGHVGGDLVGAFAVDEETFAIYAVDVSGHGVSSALLTARIAGYLSAANPDQNIAIARDSAGRPVARDPAATAEVLNELLLSEFDTDLYCTLALGLVHRSGRVRITQAGHPHPAVIDTLGRARFVGTGGPPVGLLPGCAYESFTIRLGPGERLMFYSDGLTECPTPAGTQLEEEGLARLIAAERGDGAVWLDRLVERLLAYAGRAQLDDDVSIISATLAP